MLPLSEAGQVERARGAVKACENEVKAIIAERGINGRMIIEFDKLEIFGTPDETRVVYMKIKEDTDQFELLREVNHILIQSLIDHKVLQRRELSHVNLNPKTKRYESDKLHLTLLNSSFAIKDLMKDNKRTFCSKDVMDNHGDIKFENGFAKTIEISTRFNYEESTGFYKS